MFIEILYLIVCNFYKIAFFYLNHLQRREKVETFLDNFIGNNFDNSVL